MSREKARDQDRFEIVRRERLQSGGVLSARPDGNDQPAIDYWPGEVVTRVGMVDEVEEELRQIGAGPRGRRELRDGSEADTPVIIEVDGDPVDLIQRVGERRRGRGAGELDAAPNHVLSIGRTKIGPGSDPWPGPPGEPRPAGGPAVTGQAPVIGVIDTGSWQPMPVSVAITDAGGAQDLDPVDASPGDQVVDYPGAGHGGFIAGVISHNARGIGIITRRGYRPGSQDVLTEDSVVRAGDEAVAMGCRILNLSLGTYARQPILLHDAVRRWVAQGCLVVAAAGNDNLTRSWYPAGFAADPTLAHGVVAVGALEARAGDGPGVFAAAAPFSNHGSWVTAWAPGADVVSEYPEGMRFPYGANDLSDPFDDGLAHWDGTSFAAPFAAAEIARFAVERGIGDVQEAWAVLKDGSPFVVFWPSWATGGDEDSTRGRFSTPL